MNVLQKFLIICSGSNINILRKTPTEWNKHAGMGGVILFTAIYASISAGYALFTIFDNVYLALAMALLWGMMIFNLDRFIVSSMKNYGKKSSLLLQVIPRLLLAFFLGVVISKPLELKVFEKEIDKQLNVIINRNKKELQDSIQGRYMAQTYVYTQEKDSILARTQQLRNEYNEAALELEKEIIGTGSETTSGKAGFGSNAKRKTQLLADKKETLQQYINANKPKIDSLEQNVQSIYKNQENEIENSHTIENKYNGILARLQALDELTQKSKIMKWASLFIMGIFIMLEVSPVFVKLISPTGPYDDRMRTHDYMEKSYSEEITTKEKIKSKNRVNMLQDSIEKNKT